MRLYLGHQGGQLHPVEFPGEWPGAAVGQFLIQGQPQTQRFQVHEVVGLSTFRWMIEK